MLRIGKINLDSNLLLAPMAGYCDLAFRLAIRPLGGIGMAYTDLVNPRGLLRQTISTMRLVDTDPMDQPLGMQLYGSNADEIAEAAQWCEANGAALVDINMGCPVEKICRQNGGAAMMRDPDHAVRLTAQVVKAVRVPVTVKMRVGWDDTSRFAPELASALEDVGAAAITVHGRTGEQKFGGTVRIDEIARVVRAVRHIPVIGNGDIRCPADARKMIDVTGCAGIMIGRWALRDPWIFRDTLALLKTGSIPPPPSVSERLEFMNAHFRHLLRWRGEEMAVKIFRSRITSYRQKLAWGKRFHDRLQKISSAAEYWDVVADYPSKDHDSMTQSR